MAKARAKPKGYRSITPNLVFRDAGRAIDYYKKVFGAKETVRMPGPGGKVLHAELKIGDSLIFVSDTMSDLPTSAKETPPFHPLSLHLYVKNADTVFQRAVEEGAEVKMPLQNMFWGDRYGQISDPFGQQWSIATHVEDVPPEEMSRRQQEAFSKAASRG